MRLVNQPAFCYHLDTPIEVAGLGTIRIDIAHGGMTCAMVNAAALGFAIEPSEARKLCMLGRRIKAAAAEQLQVEHPESPAIPGFTNTQFMGPIRRENGHLIARNTVVVSPGRCDRSPCGADLGRAQQDPRRCLGEVTRGPGLSVVRAKTYDEAVDLALARADG